MHAATRNQRAAHSGALTNGVSRAMPCPAPSCTPVEHRRADDVAAPELGEEGAALAHGSRYSLTSAPSRRT